MFPAISRHTGAERMISFYKIYFTEQRHRPMNLNTLSQSLSKTHSQSLFGSSLLRLALLSPLLAIVPACGTPSNTNIPKKAPDLSKSDIADPTLQAQNNRWESLAKALGIGNNQATTEKGLAAQLATPSDIFNATDPTKLLSWTEKLKVEHTKNAYATRCKSIEAVTELTDFSGGRYADDTGALQTLGGDSAVKVYQIKYKLQKNAAGEAEDNTRSGLVVVPTGANNGSAPFVSFGHGGDQGLSYTDIARVFGQAQNSHIIIAASFPAEPLCKSGIVYTGPADQSRCENNEVLAQGVGTLNPYNNDVDDLMGLHDCIVKASTPTSAAMPPSGFVISAPIKDSSGATVGVLNSALYAKVRRSKVKLLKADGTYDVVSSVPVSYLTGASRGALVANLALAKTGAALKATADATAAGTTASLASTLGAGYKPTFFSCAATLFPPSSFAIAEYRLGLERVVKGSSKNSNFSRLPTAAALEAEFEEYRKGNISADEAALLVAKRDATFNSGLISLALRNWAEQTPGPFMILHGLKDAIVPVSQTWAAGQIISQVSKALAALTASTSKVPGLKMTVLGMAPNSADLADATITDVSKQTLKKGLTQHGDGSYARSKSLLDLTAANLTTPAPTAVLGNTSAELVGSWLATGDCSQASDPLVP